MARALVRSIAIAAWAFLGGLALAGVATSAIVASTGWPAGRAAVAALLTHALDGVMAGRLSLDGLELLRDGEVAARGVVVRDPDGHVVLAVPRARLSLDAARLAARTVRVTALLDAPSFVVAEEPDGGVSAARAFAQAAPSRDAGASPPGRTRWTLELARVSVRDGALAWRRRDGSAAVEGTGIELDAQGRLSEAGSFVLIRLRGNTAAPLAAPIALDAAADLDGARLSVRHLELALGATTLAGVGVVDLGTGEFRAAVSRLGLAASDARALAPVAALGGDLTGEAYAEFEGGVASAALEISPAGAGSSGGSAVAAIAWLGGASARRVGIDVALAALDPSHLLEQAPRGRLTLTARGSAAWRGWADGSGRLVLELAPSRLRDGELGPATLVARADHGVIEVEKLEVRLPGASVEASGRWTHRGSVAGRAQLRAHDLSLLLRNVTALTGVTLPHGGGRLDARVTAAGRAAAPNLSAVVDAPLLLAGAARAERVALSLDAAGPLAAPTLRLRGRAARASWASTHLRELELAAAVAGDDATVSVAGLLPRGGRERIAVEGAARVLPGRRGVEVRRLVMAWPGSRFELARNASVTFSPPGVDRAELTDGPRSVAVSGGLRPGGALDVRFQASRLELDTLARGLLPPDDVVRGVLSITGRVSGTTRKPSLEGRIVVEEAEVRGVGGLSGLAHVRWDGRGRLGGDLQIEREGGGALAVAASVPVPLIGAPPGEPVSLTVDASAWRIGVLRTALNIAAPVEGTLGGSVVVRGTVAAPTASVTVNLEEAAVSDLEPLAATFTLEGAGGGARLVARARLAGAPLVDVDAALQSDVTGLLRHPQATLAALARARVSGSMRIPGLELARVAGKAGMPRQLGGLVSGSAELSGTPRAPRGRGAFAMERGAIGGYGDVAARLELLAEAHRTALTARASVGGAEALRATAALAVPLERLVDAAVLRSAPLTLDATVPAVSLASAAGAALPLAGTISGTVTARGSLEKPEGHVQFSGTAVEVKGRPLGDVAGDLRHAGSRMAADLTLRPRAGGELRAIATLAAPLGYGLDVTSLGDAPATLRVTSDRLALGVVAALLPGLVRSADGTLTVDLAAEGPLAKLRPRGTLKVERGSVDLVDVGEWSDAELVVSLGEHDIEVPRLEARRRGSGQVSGKLSLRGLGTAKALLAGHLDLKNVAVSRRGADLATLDLPVDLEGTLTDELLDAKVSLAAGTIRLPRKASGELQSLEGRSDIIEVDAAARATRKAGSAVPVPWAVRCRIVAPGRLFVRSEKPAMNIELKADTTFHLAGERLTADGAVEAVRGTVEPISGRVFQLERARVSFTRGFLESALVDVVARYDNPAAIVTVTVAGTVLKPTVQFSSRPPLDDATIAMLIATGTTDINLNTSGVNTLTPQQAGEAVAGAALNAAFTGIVADKLPVDQLSIDTTAVRAGKYVTDKIFVGYTRRFEAKREEGENENEMKGQYRITPRWNFEVRYGDAQAGDASLIWSKDY